jgi:hypothetical protein
MRIHASITRALAHTPTPTQMEALADAKVRTLSQYQTFVLPIVQNVLRSCGIDISLEVKLSHYADP